MDRRCFLKGIAGVPLTTGLYAGSASPASAQPKSQLARLGRVRPGESGWPDPKTWARLNEQVGGRLLHPGPALEDCHRESDGLACRDLFRELKNPYFIGDDPRLTQTCGWVGAWTAQPSVYVVAASNAQDVAAAVNFAREHQLRLVVRGGGHSYLGTSSAPDSLMVWTRAMNQAILHDAFVPSGCSDTSGPAVTLGAGVIWMHAYDTVTTRGGRFVQGGGCGTVGVAGLVLGGGFGSFSRAYGTAAASLLEAEVVTADGAVRVVNACTNADLFWALKGGGGGSLGVVTRVTLRTHDLPAFFGVVGMTVQAASDDAYRRLMGRFTRFYAESLNNPHWGEIVTLRRSNRMQVNMVSQGLDQAEAETIWQPFLAWLAEAPDEFRFLRPPEIVAFPSRKAWDPAFLMLHPGTVLADDRPGAPAGNIFWTANRAEAGHVLYGFESLWLPDVLLQPSRQDELAGALFAASRQWTVELHFQKGLSGSAPAARAAVADTAMNPAVLDAFALAIIASEGPPGFPGLAGHEPDAAAARRDAAQIGKAMAELRRVAPGGGAYVAECDFFQAAWQEACWGRNYPGLLEVKRRYDPDGLFCVHHGIGSEDWSPDGFTRMAQQ